MSQAKTYELSTDKDEERAIISIATGSIKTTDTSLILIDEDRNEVATLHLMNNVKYRSLL